MGRDDDSSCVNSRKTLISYVVPFLKPYFMMLSFSFIVSCAGSIFFSCLN